MPLSFLNLSTLDFHSLLLHADENFSKHGKNSGVEYFCLAPEASGKTFFFSPLGQTNLLLSFESSSLEVTHSFTRMVITTYRRLGTVVILALAILKYRIR